MKIRRNTIVLFLSLISFLLATGVSAQEPTTDSTQRTEGGSYEDYILENPPNVNLLNPEKISLLDTSDNLLGTNLIVNGGFETGNFSGWTVSPFGNQGWYPWQVTAAGSGSTTGGIQTSSPFQGTRSAWNGFCCNTIVNPEYIYQDVTIPALSSAVLTWADKVQSNLSSFCSPPGCGSNIYRVEILNPATNSVLTTLYTFTAAGGANYNTGWVTHSANLSAFAGQTVRLRFSTNYTSLIGGNYNGPGRVEIDAVSLTVGPQVVYMRSAVYPPWGQTTNEAAMNTVFGAGNWHDLRYETAVAADIFSSSISLVFMEGGDSNANEMETFLNNNQALIENWVANGGRLFLNAAPNEGNGMNLGFDNTALIYPSFSGSGSAFSAPGQNSHPIFNTPYTPAGTTFYGSSFNHATINCTVGCTTLIVSGGALPVLVSKPFGSGLVLFGGMTTTNFQGPQPNATNLRKNILYFLNNTAVNTNSSPVAADDSFSTDEDTTLSVPANGVLGNDSDAENNPLTAVLATSPANAASFTLNPDGSFEYSPNPDFNGLDSFTYKANDGQADSNIVTVNITVNAINDAPSLAGVPASPAIDELVAYNFTASANDIDVPAQTLSFSLVGAPAGATIDGSSGLFAWTPDETQGPGNYSFTVRVSDGVENTDAGISITVNEVNAAPTLSNVPVSAVIDELAPYNFTATSTDADIPGQTLTFSLVGAPAGASINPSTGEFTWTPNEAQGGSGAVYGFAVRVSDGVTNTDAPISLTVEEVNSAPVLNAVADQTIDEETLLTVSTGANDSDDPANDLTYSLDAGYPAGMTIDPNTGAISWTPSEEQGVGDYPVTVRVTDNGAGNLFDTKTFNVHVNEVNVAPELAAIGNSVIDEQSSFGFTATASDADLPANNLSFSLIGAPAGASITPGGAFSWTPTEEQGPGTYMFTVKVTDDGSPALSDEEQITIAVNEVNLPPELNTIGNQTGYWGNAFGFTATASDPDIPANTLTFSLIGEPAGAAIHPSSGVFAWIPSSAQIGSHTFTVRVTDSGTPNLYDEQSVTINVGKRPTTIVYHGEDEKQYSDQAALSATLTDTGFGTPLSGKTIVFDLGTQNASDSTDASGTAAADLILTQNPNINYTVDSSFAGDALYLPATDSDPFDILQEDARAYYTGTLFVNTACATCGNGTATLSATVRDITAETSDPAYDSLAGDIRNATVTFINRDTNTPIAGCSNLSVGLVDPADPQTGTATCNWNVNIGSSDSLDYTVGIVVNSYYTRNASTEDAILTVSKPLGTNFITGGGYLVNEFSNGQYAGITGLKTNFGFNVKYNKSGTNLQGRINVIVRGNDGRIYQIKGNVMRTLSVRNVSNNPLVRAAVYTGKANMTDITDPLNPVTLGGNNSFQMEMTDKGEPGSTDTIGITVWNDAGGLLFASRWNGTRTIEQLLGGGNLVVR